MNNAPFDRPAFGDEPPLVADRKRRPDRRQVSARWLAGTLLTGITSTALMGIALSAALDGHNGLARPVALVFDPMRTDDISEKGERVFATAVPAVRSRQTLELSTMTREGDREVIRTLPFALVSMALAARYPTAASYPAFDAMKVFADDAAPPPEDAADPGQIYGNKMEAEVRLKVEPFDVDATELDESGDIDVSEAERLVRGIGPDLSDKPVQVAALRPFDAMRFATASDVEDYEPGSAFRITTQNVSIAPSDQTDADSARYAEEIIPFRETRTIEEALAESGYTDPASVSAATRMAELLSSKSLKAGNVLRVGTDNSRGQPSIVRLSVYRGERHILTVAQDDGGTFEPAEAPAVSAAVAEAFDENATEAPMRSDMPTVYDGIYQAALAYGLNDRLCQQLIRMLASDVDFQSRLDPKDRLTVFYSLAEGEEKATDESEILYVEARFGDMSKKYYRFRGGEDDRIDYYDEEGRSAKQFLLRNPVPNGRFTSPFGGRKHPILGYVRMHWGVDWAAPRGTPILASGSGVVEKAGWSSGNGRQTIIKHPNGYESSYSHQSGIAKGVVPGAKVRQGQVIGYVGATGLATGNHLHYELSVNGTRVDPMRVKLPSGRALQGDELEVFKRERDRIDKLLQERDLKTRVAGR
ncbi:M23 family metallopeptidase [Mangrovicella endophytica]|uniref:M23 family metallopeptidase n=1 Tax=Mangrovicella endophytica TaxID=2066697 RepID=UPI001FDF6C83|nr:M23 family metallopeptidase [Mangrovicella endophytica]